MKLINTLRLAPALCRNHKGEWFVTTHMFTSNEEAIAHCEQQFVRWLVDTPYEISL